MKPYLKKSLQASSKDNTLKIVYRGGHREMLAPVFWSTDIKVAMAFYNEVRYIANMGNKNLTLTISDVREIQTSIEPYEDIDWVLDWDIIGGLGSDIAKYKNLKEALKNIFNNIPKKLIISENPNTALLQGIPTYENPLILDFKGKIWGETDAIIEHHFKEAKKNGNDVIICNNIIEGGLGSPIGDKPATTFVDISGGHVINITDVEEYPKIEEY